jgi:hypothetical protein
MILADRPLSQITGGSADYWFTAWTFFAKGPARLFACPTLSRISHLFAGNLLFAIASRKTSVGRPCCVRCAPQSPAAHLPRKRRNRAPRRNARLCLCHPMRPTSPGRVLRRTRLRSHRHRGARCAARMVVLARHREGIADDGFEDQPV